MATDIDELKAWLRTYPDGPLSPASTFLTAIDMLQKELADAQAVILEVFPTKGMILGDTTGNSREWRTRAIAAEIHRQALQRELADARDLPSIAYMTAREDSAKEIAGLKAENAALREVYKIAEADIDASDEYCTMMRRMLRKVREREAKK